MSDKKGVCMRKLIQYGALLLVFTLAGCQSVESGTPMPIRNAGFEGVINNQTLPGWSYEEHAGKWRGQAFEVASNSSAGPGGSRALRMTRLQEEDYAMVHQKVRVRPEDAGKTMRFSAMMRTDSVGPKGWKLVVTLVNGGIFLDQVRSTPVSGTSEWSRSSVTAVIPVGTTDLDVGFLHQDSGTGWASDPMLVIE